MDRWTVEMGACRFEAAAGSTSSAQYDSGNPVLKPRERQGQDWLGLGTQSRNRSHDDHQAVSGPEALEDEQEGVVVLCHRVAAGHRGAGTSLEAGGAWYWGAVGAVAAAEGVGRERRRASRHLQDNPLGQRHAPGSEHFAGEDKRRVLAQTLALAKRRE